MNRSQLHKKTQLLSAVCSKEDLSTIAPCPKENLSIEASHTKADSPTTNTTTPISQNNNTQPTNTITTQCTSLALTKYNPKNYSLSQLYKNLQLLSAVAPYPKEDLSTIAPYPKADLSAEAPCAKADSPTPKITNLNSPNNNI